MWSAATILVCALDLLGRSAPSLPPIAFVDTRPPDVSERAEAFVRIGDPTIYLLTSSALFKEAQSSREKCGGFHALRKLASVIVHEEWHVRHGTDERGAYEAQLTALASMSAGLGTAVYGDVIRAMRAAVETQKRMAREGQRASAAPAVWDPDDGARARLKIQSAHVYATVPLVSLYTW
ncbi:MAG TPA: hypothetical protein VFB92_00025 [Vicinamibacterales bacterium]|nr:hypothetical protein [Vicinamibacterales bacterium]